MNKEVLFRGSLPVLLVALGLAVQTASLEAQPVQAPGPMPIDSGGSVTRTGTFTIVWGDPGLQAGGEGERFYSLITGRGERILLWLDEALAASQGGAIALNGQRVAVRGRRLEPVPPGAVAVMQVEAIQRLPRPDMAGEDGIIGSQPWVSVMCKFADIPDEPKDLDYFQGMYGSTFPGEDHYWREISYDTVNLEGSEAQGWYTLPQPWSYYVYDMNGDGAPDLDHGRAAADCTAVADPDIYYPDFVGINLMFNATLDCCAWGGSWYLELDGVGKVYRMTWEPPWGYENVTVISHEMGHGFGLPHSSGDYGLVYDNRWDVMSDTWTDCPNLTHPVYGCVGQGTITYHLGLPEWIPDERKAVVPAGETMTVQLEQTDQPQTDHHLMAKIPVGDSDSHFFTVEARRKVGYDQKLPGQGVIIHEVITNRGEPAHVVDIDGNGNTGDAGAVWVVGEVFTDPDSGIWVQVDSVQPTGWTVTIHNPALNRIQVTSTLQSPGEVGDCTLGEAMEAANTDTAVDGCIAGQGTDEILLPEGIYVLTQVDNNVGGSNGLPNITSAIYLTGAGQNASVIRRQAGAPPFRILRVSPIGSLIASGIGVQGGHAGAGDGGGVWVGGSLVLSESAVALNSARRGGGIAVATGATADISTTTIRANLAVDSGGGVLIEEGVASIAASTVSANWSGGSGAGTQNWAGLLNLSGTGIADNRAIVDGGGLLDQAGLSTIDGCRFTGNSQDALLSNSGTLDVSNTWVRASGRRGIECWYCELSVDSSVVYDNQPDNGGAILAFSSQPLSVSNSCIAGNSDIAVYNEGSTTLMDATANWWGAADGPSGAGPGQGDSVSGNVSFAPFLIQRPAFCPEWPAAHVQAILLLSRNPGVELVLGLVRVVNGHNAPVPGALVDLEWALPNGIAVPQTKATSASGLALAVMLRNWSGMYDLCVEDIRADGYAYEPDMNVETCDTINLP